MTTENTAPREQQPAPESYGGMKPGESNDRAVRNPDKPSPEPTPEPTPAPAPTAPVSNPTPAPATPAPGDEGTKATR